METICLGSIEWPLRLIHCCGSGFSTFHFLKVFASCNDFHFSCMNEWPFFWKGGKWRRWMTARATFVEYQLIMIHIERTWLTTKLQKLWVIQPQTFDRLDHRNHRVNPKMNHVQNPEKERTRQDGTCSAPYFYRGTCPFSVNLLNYTQGMKACGVTSSGSGRLYIVVLGISTTKFTKHFRKNGGC